MRRLRIPQDVASLIRGLHPDIRRKVRAACEDLLKNPETGKALQKELSGLRSYRLGRLRIIYRIAATRVVEIVAVGPRRVIYEETLRLLRGRRQDR